MKPNRPLTLLAVAVLSASGLWACASDFYQRVPGRFVAMGGDLVVRVDAKDLGGASGGLANGAQYADVLVRDDGLLPLARAVSGLRLEVAGVVRCWCGGGGCEIYPSAVLVPKDVAEREAVASPWVACRRCGLLNRESVSWFGFPLPAGRARPLASQGTVMGHTREWAAIEAIALPLGHQRLVARCTHSWLPLQGLRGRNGGPPFVFTSPVEFDEQTSWLRLLLDLHERSARPAREGGGRDGPGATPPEVRLRRLAAAAELLRGRLCRPEAPVPFLPEDLRPSWERPWFDHTGFPLNFEAGGLDPVASWLIDDSGGSPVVYDEPRVRDR